MRQRNYTFVSEWRIPAPIADVEHALLNTKAWQQWWDSLEELEALHDTVGVGSSFHCKWRSMTGYRLDLTIEITHYDRGRNISFTSAGDLVGEGSFEMNPTGDDLTEIVIHWNVSTTKRWMNIFGPVLRPLFVMNHDKLMREGEMGLANYIRTAHN